jgi:hypothetical protein
MHRLNLQMDGSEMVLDSGRLPLHDGPEVGRAQPLQVSLVRAAPHPRPVSHPPGDQARVARDAAREGVQELGLHDVIALGDRYRVYQEVKSVRRQRHFVFDFRSVPVSFSRGRSRDPSARSPFFSRP